MCSRQRVPQTSVFFRVSITQFFLSALGHLWGREDLITLRLKGKEEKTLAVLDKEQLNWSITHLREREDENRGLQAT